jgi:hypothetical protein
MALAKLMDMDRLKYIISQNVDGLHLKSGVPHNKIAELHGNVNLERCTECSKHYLRDYNVRTAVEPNDHKTGSICENKKCRAELVDTIVNTNESALQAGFEQAAKADLFICIGSSMRQHPACDMPLKCLKNGGRVVMINLQKTPVDDVSSLVVHGKIDEIFPKLAQKLDIEITKWKLTRRICFILNPTEDNKKLLEIRSVEKDSSIYTIFTKVIVNTDGSKYVSNSEPYEFVDNFDKPFTVDLHFQGYYGEPPLELTIDPENIYGRTFALEYDLDKKKWEKSDTIKNL